MTNKTVEISSEYAGKTLLEALGKEGLFVNADCGGSGRCGKCTVEIFDNGWKTVRSCRYIIGKNGATARLKPEEDEKETAHGEKPGKTGFTAAFDIGTTTLEAALISDGNILKTAAILNPQKTHGADVLSRIKYASESPENVKLLQREAREGLRRLMDKLGLARADKLGVCGNPTMTHLFCGINPENAGKSPYYPEFSEKKVLKSNEFAEETVILPGSSRAFAGSAFIGSDVVAATCKARLCDGDMLIDLGTNGEIVFKKNGVYFAGSTAAGPCFEGGSITCGTGGVPGAISHVENRNGVLSYGTVDDAKPTGICGAGLIDLVAVLLENGKIAPDGYMAERFEITGIRGHRVEESGTYLEPSDVRAFQLAKAAVSAGIEIVLEAAGAKPEDVGKIYVAGSLGKYINTENAIKSGVFPAFFRGKTKAVGNSALRGAAEYVCSVDFAAEADEISEKISVVNVGSAPSFNERFIGKINFTEEKNDTGV